MAEGNHQLVDSNRGASILLACPSLLSSNNRRTANPYVSKVACPQERRIRVTIDEC